MKTLAFISEETTWEEALKPLTYKYIFKHFHGSLEVLCIYFNKKKRKAYIYLFLVIALQIICSHTYSIFNKEWMQGK